MLGRQLTKKNLGAAINVHETEPRRHLFDKNYFIPKGFDTFFDRRLDRINPCMLYIGLGTEFSSEKISRNRLGMVSVIPRKKVLIPGHSEFRGRANFEARNGTERNSAKNWSFTELAQLLCSLWRPLHSTLIIFLFHGMVRNGIPRVCFYFCSTERNSKLIFLPLKSSEGNFESLLLVWYHGTEFRVVFSSAEGFGRQFWEFACIFVQQNGIPNCFLFPGRVWNGIPRVSFPRNSRNSVGNNHLFRLFRLPRNYFFVGNSQL